MRKEHSRRVYRLAEEVGCDPTAAVEELQRSGIPVSQANDLLAPRDRERAMDALRRRWPTEQASPTPKHPSPTTSGKHMGVGPREAATDARDDTSTKTSLKRQLVGHPAGEMEFLTPKDVERIHWKLVDDFRKGKDPIEPPGIKSLGLLESAVFRPQTSHTGEPKYPTIPMAAAAYLFGLIHNHPFHNGNKRTALVSTLVFQDMNGYVLEEQDDILYDQMLLIAQHDVRPNKHSDPYCDGETVGIAEWLHAKSRPLSKDERILQFHELRNILRTYGCSFDQPRKGNRINIIRGNNQVQVKYRNEGTDVNRNTIRHIRKELALTEADGYDSTIFYNANAKMPEFVAKYRKVLDRLAKV